MAESLEPVALPLETTLRCLRSGKPAEIVARMAQALSRPRDQRPLPEWLRPEQRAACSHLLPMLERYDCALLADPVGTGKTYVALAVAALWSGQAPATVLAPAALINQWERAAAVTGVPVKLWSHERLSRGNLPPQLRRNSNGTLVVIDESHHFRNPATLRYRHVAQSLIGRAVLLLSATPVVNTAEDLAAQLALGARDDVLIAFGIPSLRKHLATSGAAPGALGELILTGRRGGWKRPERVQRKERGLAEDADLAARCGMIERLSLSGNSATAALIRSVMWRAMASSDMALLAVLRRYRALLLQARDAAQSGRIISRSAVRSLVGEAPDQLVMWGLFLQPESTGDLVVADLDPLDELIAQLKPQSRATDSKCRRLVSLVQDGRPTLVFTGARETVHYLREHLPRAAWCTGTAAGIGITRMARDDVLAWFRPGAPAAVGPAILITTDVSAEGLDLQQAARVVHYDLPWTAVRIDQRNGRALRLGSRHESVEVIRFELPGPIEQRMGQLGAIARKRRLPGKTGIDAQGARAWRWREDIAARFGAGTGSRGPQSCGILSPGQGILAGFSLYTDDGAGVRRKVSTVVGFADSDGKWSEEPQLVTRLMDLAVTAAPGNARCPADQKGLAAVAEVIRQRLALLQQAQWSRHLSPLQSRMIARLNRLAARAVHARKVPLLASIDRGISFVRRGHTAGEELWLERLLPLPDAALLEAIRRCSEAERTTPSSYSELLGVVVFTPSDY